MKFAAVFVFLAAPLWGASYFAYTGTYTSGESKGIYAYRFDSSRGAMKEIGLAVEASNPSFLAVAPNQRFVYAVNENSQGAVSAFAIEPETGRLRFLNSVSSKGAGPCHIAFDKTGKWIFAANYSSGSVAVFPVHADGSVGEASAFAQHSGSSINPQRQEGPHAHTVAISPDNRFALVADLGLDHVMVYRFDAAKGTLAPADPAFAQVAPGSGPRHLAFGSSGKFVYALNEMGGTIAAFGYDAARGALRQIQTISTLPADFKGQNSSAEIAVHPNGRFLYASNRGHDSIAIFSIAAAGGKLMPVDRVSTGGKTPRSFAIDPTGRFLFAANQDSDAVMPFRIDPKTGRLTALAGALRVPNPVSIVFAAVK